MFDLIRKRRPQPESNDGPPIRLLAVTEKAADWDGLRGIAERCGWQLLWANSCDEALRTLAQHPIPIVICDRDLPGEDWRTVVKRISARQQPICVLLASSVSDEYLWREVVQCQGFDIATKPFQADRLIRLVNLGRSWEGWMHRHPSQSRSRQA